MAWFAWLYIICDNFFCYEYQIKLSIIIGLFFKFKISSCIWYIHYIKNILHELTGPFEIRQKPWNLDQSLTVIIYTHQSRGAPVRKWLIGYLIDWFNNLSLIQSIIHIFMHFNLLFSPFQEASFYVFHYNS